MSLRESLETPPQHYCHSYQQLDNVPCIVPGNLSKLSWFILSEQKKRLKSFMKAVPQNYQVSNVCYRSPVTLRTEQQTLLRAESFAT